MKKYVPTVLSSIFLTFSLTACQGVNDVLDGVNNTLGAVNSVLGGVTGSTSTGSSGSSSVYVDSQAQSSTVSATNKAVAANSAKNMFNEAKPAITKMVSTSACADNQRQLARFLDPDSVWLPLPLDNVRYHKSGCLSVLRINNVQKITANAFSFTVYYISPQSEETTTHTYRAIKQPDGEWLFKW